MVLIVNIAAGTRWKKVALTNRKLRRSDLTHYEILRRFSSREQVSVIILQITYGEGCKKTQNIHISGLLGNFRPSGSGSMAGVVVLVTGHVQCLMSHIFICLLAGSIPAMMLPVDV